MLGSRWRGGCFQISWRGCRESVRDGSRRTQASAACKSSRAEIWLPRPRARGTHCGLGCGWLCLHPPWAVDFGSPACEEPGDVRGTELRQAPILLPGRYNSHQARGPCPPTLAVDKIPWGRASSRALLPERMPSWAGTCKEGKDPPGQRPLGIETGSPRLRPSSRRPR